MKVNQLPNDKILDWSKFKRIEDDILKCVSHSCFSLVHQDVALCGNGLIKTSVERNEMVNGQQ